MPDLSLPFRKMFTPSISLLLLAGLSNTSLALELDEGSLQEKLRPHASVDEIARQINQQPQWRILAAEPTIENDKTFYRFKLLDKKRGRVQIIIIDPDEPELKQLD
jgi:hypothetical protein